MESINDVIYRMEAAIGASQASRDMSIITYHSADEDIKMIIREVKDLRRQVKMKDDIIKGMEKALNSARQK